MCSWFFSLVISYLLERDTCLDQPNKMFARAPHPYYLVLMKKPASPEAFIADAPDHWRPQLITLREIMLEQEALSEAIKWAFPVYSLGKKNVASIFYTKAYVGAWFPQGALLKDPEGHLVNASPGKTVAQRQLRFGPDKPVDVSLVRSFLAEAIANQEMGLELKPAPASAPKIPALLQDTLDNDIDLAKAFAALPPYKQKEFCESIGEAKREATKLRRLEKAVDLIRAGKGLSDKYRK